MRRISSHEPRYKHSTQGRKNKHADLREQSQTSSSEEEDDSTDSEESESSSENETPQGGSFPSVADFSKRGAVKKTSRPETFLHTRIDGTKILMLDKVTQKNLLSPFPSFTLPPVYKEIVRPGIQRKPETRRFVEDDRKQSGKPPKPHPKKKETRIEEDESSGSIQKYIERVRRKSKEGGHCSKGRHSQRVLSCVSGCEVKDTSRRVLKPPTQSEVPPKPVEPIMSPRKRKTEPRDPVKNVETRDEQRKTVRSAGFSAKQDSQKPIKAEEKGETCEGGGGEVKEKLVYVLEEKGKEKRKVETDIFTLNEILTIKKDLLELGEFAKKLKRLKEMAREPENGNQQNQQIYCHCKPASDLLRDVNRRIEALEARQEELEKGIKPGCRGDIELYSKKETEVKTLSEYQSNVADMPKQSALSTAPSFHRMEMILPKADGFSNNSDIVNELMDIKTQLQKLEKRRMSKEIPESLECADIMKQSKLDDRGIAVFSSKTYILTENVKKIEELRPEVKPEAKPEMKAERETEGSKTTEGNSKSDRTKGDVENWLRSVTPTHMENVTVCEMTKGLKNRGHSQKESQQTDLKRKDCSTISKNEKFENQEQPKNRATRKGEKEADSGVIDLAENVTPSGQCNRHLQYKECIVTPSGKIFARITKSKTQPLQEFPMGNQARPQRAQSARCRSPEEIRATGSCSSIPSIPHAKEGRRKLQEHPKALKSKSVHELSTSSSGFKCEKTERNTSIKNSDKAAQTKLRAKRHKEDKNELVKYLEAHKKSLYQNAGKPSRISSSHSEFLASMNLDAAPHSLAMDSSGFLLNSEKRDIIMSYPATNEAEDLQERSPCCSLYLEGESAKKKCKEERKRMKKKESELKKILKRQIKEYQRQKKKLKKEQKRREVELINEFKCQKFKCLQKCKAEFDSKKEALVGNKRDNKLQCTVVDAEREDPCEVKTEAKEIQCRREESATSGSTESGVSPIWKKSDSLEMYKKTLKKALMDEDIKKALNECDDKSQLKPMVICQEKKPARPVCDQSHYARKARRSQVDKRWLKNFMRNLELVYPRFCALSSSTNCHHEKKKKFTETCSWRSLCGKHSSRFKKSGQYDEYAATESEDSESGNKFANQHHGHHFYDYNQQLRPENFPCKCMRVYMQTQMQNGWSGLRAIQKSSTDTSTELTRSRSAPTCDSNKSSFVASGPKSQICLAAHESREDRKKRKRKHRKRGKKKRKHKSYCCNKKCKCRACRDRKEEFSDSDSNTGSHRSRKSKKKLASYSFSNRGRSRGDIFPMFSFLSHFCKSKPRENKFSLKRITEIPQLKTCSTTRKKRSTHSSRKRRKRKRKSRDRLSNETPSSTESRRRKKKGKKKSKWCSNGKRKKKHRRSDSESDGDSRGSRREKRRKKKKRKADSECESDSPGSRKGRKHKKKHKKKSSDEEYERKKKKKRKKKRGCSSACICRTNCPETAAYYQTIEPSRFPSKTEETGSSESTESSESSSSEDSRCYCEPKCPPLPSPQQKHRPLKDRLSSFHSFWKHFRKTKPSKPSKPSKPLPDKTEEKKIELSSDSSFINDCSRSSEIPRGKQVVEMKAEPTSFAKIRKKREKLSKEEKKSRKASKKETTTPKSKSARRRHI